MNSFFIQGFSKCLSVMKFSYYMHLCTISMKMGVPITTHWVYTLLHFLSLLNWSWLLFSYVAYIYANEMVFFTKFKFWLGLNFWQWYNGSQWQRVSIWIYWHELTARGREKGHGPVVVSMFASHHQGQGCIWNHVWASHLCLQMMEETERLQCWLLPVASKSPLYDPSLYFYSMVIVLKRLQMVRLIQMYCARLSTTAVI